MRGCRLVQHHYCNGGGRALVLNDEHRLICVKEEGKEEAFTKTVPMLLQSGFSIEEIADRLRLHDRAGLSICSGPKLIRSPFSAGFTCGGIEAKWCFLR